MGHVWEMNMRAVGYSRPLPIDDPSALVDVELRRVAPTGRDIEVAVHAISVNPVDTKVRRRAAPPPGDIKVLGWDAAGIVSAVGPEATLFRPGDAVFYAGSILRPGTNSEYHLVDERIVGPKPSSSSFAEAAALPLTAITAWELLFDRLGLERASRDEGTLLIVGGAGGVGSILIQLARKLTGLTVIATASRPETRNWCVALGAHHVIDHARPLHEELRAIGIPQVNFVASLTHTEAHYTSIVEALAPQGRLGLIDDPVSPLDALPLKRKSISLHWELMFTRSIFETPDMIKQSQLLTEIAGLIDSGALRTTLAEHFGPINAANLRRAHALIESGQSRGKSVLEGF
jgi:zinc-binding alcohol dehydrogenase family protein